MTKCGVTTLLLAVGISSAQWVEKTIILPDPLGGCNRTWDMAYNTVDDVMYVGGVGCVVAVDAAAGIRVAKFEVVGQVASMCHAPSENRLFVTSLDGMLVLDCEDLSVVARISVTGELCYEPMSDRVYCASSSEDSAAVIDPRSLQILYRVPVGEGKITYCFNGRQRKAYIAARRSDNVTVVDMDSDTVFAVLAMPRAPTALCCDTLLDRVWVACEGNQVRVIDCSGDSVVARIGSVGGPRSLVFAPAGRKVYCANNYNEAVAVIDAVGDSVLSVIRVGDGPMALEYSETNGRVYCATNASDMLYTIDAAADTVIDSLGVGWTANELCMSIRTNRVFCLAHDGSSLAAVDAATSRLEWVVHLGMRPLRVCYNPASRKVYTANLDNFGTVSVLDADAGRVVSNLEVGAHPWDVCVNEMRNKVYVSSSRHAHAPDSIVAVIDGATDSVVRRVVAGLGPMSLCYNPERDMVYSSNVYGGDVSAIDCETDNVVARIPLGPNLGGICCNPQDDKVYVAVNLEWVAVIDCSTNAVRAALPVAWAGQPVYNPFHDVIYVLPGAIDCPVVVIDGATDTVIARIAISDVPSCVAFSPRGEKVYFGLCNRGLMVLDPVRNVFVDSIRFGRECSGVVYSATTDLVYCAIMDSCHVAVLDGLEDTLLLRVPVGKYPMGLVWVEENGRVYTADNGGSCVSVLRDARGGIAGSPTDSRPSGRGAIFARGQLWLKESATWAFLVDAAGSRRLTLLPGCNDLRKLSSGVYYICTADGSALNKVVVLND
ncbi:MAG: YncE family protein [candidate division WOR-3 bacterium]|nr:MAG: YncE family protein [candidate division WOR-3 bacterium]